MALTLNSTTRWPGTKELQRLGETRLGASPGRVRQILERVATAIAATSTELRIYAKDHPEFADIGNRMLHESEQGVSLSLRTTRARRSSSIGIWTAYRKRYNSGSHPTAFKIFDNYQKGLRSSPKHCEMYSRLPSSVAVSNRLLLGKPEAHLLITDFACQKILEAEMPRSA